jgi:hypothetical protein
MMPVFGGVHWANNSNEIVRRIANSKTNFFIGARLVRERQ